MCTGKGIRQNRLILTSQDLTKELKFGVLQYIKSQILNII